MVTERGTAGVASGTRADRRIRKASPVRAPSPRMRDTRPMRSSTTDRRGGVRVRRAVARDARRLTRLVTTSGAYEGPYAPMVQGYKVGPDYIEAHDVHVAVDDDGWCSASTRWCCPRRSST